MEREKYTAKRLGYMLPQVGGCSGARDEFQSGSVLLSDMSCGAATASRCSCTASVALSCFLGDGEDKSDRNDSSLAEEVVSEASIRTRSVTLR
jgi:hypothetical protein